jgi:hypothetical protein
MKLVILIVICEFKVSICPLTLACALFLMLIGSGQHIPFWALVFGFSMYVDFMPIDECGIVHK